MILHKVLYPTSGGKTRAFPRSRRFLRRSERRLFHAQTLCAPREDGVPFHFVTQMQPRKSADLQELSTFSTGLSTVLCQRISTERMQESHHLTTFAPFRRFRQGELRAERENGRIWGGIRPFFSTVCTALSTGAGEKCCAGLCKKVRSDAPHFFRLPRKLPLQPTCRSLQQRFSSYSS